MMITITDKQLEDLGMEKDALTEFRALYGSQWTFEWTPMSQRIMIFHRSYLCRHIDWMWDKKILPLWNTSQ